jgi:hypothetical protein
VGVGKGGGREKGGEMTQTLYAHMNKRNKKKRKCGIYTQWNFTQPQRRMKFCHL